MKRDEAADGRLTIAEYAELGETESGYTELIDGRVLTWPSPSIEHNVASLELALQLHPQLPGAIEVIQGVDVDLELAPPDMPGFSRRPDLVIIQRSARYRVGAEGGLIRAFEVLVVIEIVSPGSRHTDNVIKRAEYASAGIPHYWTVDIEEPLSLAAGEAPAVTGEFVTWEPIPLKVRVDQLT